MSFKVMSSTFVKIELNDVCLVNNNILINIQGQCYESYKV